MTLFLNVAVMISEININTAEIPLAFIQYLYLHRFIDNMKSTFYCSNISLVLTVFNET